MENYPEAYKSLKQDRYVDDILSGEDSRQGREDQIEAVQEVLKRGGFLLSLLYGAERNHQRRLVRTEKP